MEPTDTPQGTETVLVVEDHDQLRQFIGLALAGWGYKVLEARDGGQALEVCRGHPGAVDLLLTDVVLPGVSGPELVRLLRTDRPGLRVLFLSGHSEERIEQHGARPDDPILRKPFDLETLKSRVCEALGA